MRRACEKCVICVDSDRALHKVLCIYGVRSDSIADDESVALQEFARQY